MLILRDIFLLLLSIGSQLLVAYIGINIIFGVLLTVFIIIYRPTDEAIDHFLEASESNRLNEFFLPESTLLKRRKQRLTFIALLHFSFRILVYMGWFFAQAVLFHAGVKHMLFDSLSIGVLGLGFNLYFLYRAIRILRSIMQRSTTVS